MFGRIFVAVLCLSLTGCAGVLKGTDNTRVVEAVEDTDRDGPPIIMDGKLIDDALAGKIVVLPTHEKKNYRIKAYYPDGSPKYDIVTSRSEVIDSTLGGARSLNADYLAQDRWIVQQISSRIDQLFETMGAQRRREPAYEGGSSSGLTAEEVRRIIREEQAARPNP